MKTTEEPNTFKEEIETVRRKLRELSKEELMEVAGGSPAQRAQDDFRKELEERMRQQLTEASDRKAFEEYAQQRMQLMMEEVLGDALRGDQR